MAHRGAGVASREHLLVIFLFYEFLQYSIDFVDIKGYGRFCVLRIERSVGIDVAVPLHVLQSMFSESLKFRLGGD